MTLYGVEELATAAGVRPRTLASYLARGKCPAPAVRLACGPIWTEDEVQAWLEQRDSRLERLSSAGNKAFTAEVDDRMAANWDWETYRPLQARRNAASKASKRRNPKTEKELMRSAIEMQVLREGVSAERADVARRGDWAYERLAARREIRGDDGIPF